MGNRRHTTPTIIWIVSLLTISAVIAKKAPPKVEGIYEDWNGVIDKLEIVKRPRMTDFARVMVVPFDTKSTQLPQQDDNTYEPTTVVLSKATTTFSEKPAGTGLGSRGRSRSLVRALHPVHPRRDCKRLSRHRSGVSRQRRVRPRLV